MMKGELAGIPCQPNCWHIFSILPMEGVRALIIWRGIILFFLKAYRYLGWPLVSKLDSKISTNKMYFLSERRWADRGCSYTYGLELSNEGSEGHALLWEHSWQEWPCALTSHKGHDGWGHQHWAQPLILDSTSSCMCPGETIWFKSSQSFEGSQMPLIYAGAVLFGRPSTEYGA